MRRARDARHNFAIGREHLGYDVLRRALERAGCHVVYGLIGLKTHCKVALVVRREGNGIRRYVHLGTGNYNPTTARQYTDLSLFTARQEIAEDVTALCDYATGAYRRALGGARGGQGARPLRGYRRRARHHHLGLEQFEPA